MNGKVKKGKWLHKAGKLTLCFAMLVALIPNTFGMKIKARSSISAGATLTSGEYDLNSSLTAGTGQSGFSVNPGATVTVYVNGNFTVTGGNASGSTGAGAGIEVPNSSTLIIRGGNGGNRVTLTVRGGNAAGGSGGARGDNSSQSNETKGGNGGSGGAGGGGAGAGLGGKGGNGGSSNSAAGSSGGTMGAVYAIGDVNITAYGGNGSNSGGAGGGGGNGDFKEGNTGLADDLGWGGGGGGGGGGSGYPANGVGGGGAGGGAGGGGGRGGFGKDSDTDKAGGGGGGGGGAGRGYVNGAGGSGGSGSGSTGKGTNGGSGSIYGGGGAGTTAGRKDNYGGTSGGGSGAAGNGGSGGYYYKSTHNTYSGNIGGGSGASGGSGGTNRIAYDIRDATLSLSATQFVYDGNAHIPTTGDAKFGSTNISISNFKVTPPNNSVNVGTYNMTIEGKENFGTGNTYITTGTTTKPFTVTRADFTPSISYIQSDVTYGGSFDAKVANNPGGGKVTWSLTNGAATLTNNDALGNSVHVVPTSVSPITLKAVIEETANYNTQTEISTPPMNVNQKDINDVTVEAISVQTYTGNAIKPEPVVKDGVKTLVKGTDYTVAYDNNIDSTSKQGGVQAEVKINGIGNYGGTRTSYFTISKANLSAATITAQPADLIYNGSAQLSDPTLVYNGHELVLGEDYEIGNGQNNINVSAGGNKASETLTGMGNYTGDVADVTFSITPETLTSANVVITKNPEDVIFNGLKQEASEPVLQYRGKQLTKGKDYTLTYDSTTTTEVGTALITINGINNFKDSKSTSFKITPAQITVTADSDQQKYYGTEDPALLTYSYTGDFEGFQPVFTGILKRDAGERLGGYPIRQGTLKLDDTKPVNHNYTLRYVEDSFQIKVYDGSDANAYLLGTITDNNWYTDIAHICAPEGYQISLADALTDNTWSDYVTYSDGDYEKDGVTYYLKRTSDQAVSSAKNIRYKQDRKAPSGSIVIGTDAWTQMLNNVTFGLFFNSDVQAHIYGSDTLSGIQSVSYVEREREATLEELKAIAPDEWKETKIATVSGDRGIIYTRVEDMAGNITYLSTEGIVYDTEKPLLSAVYEFDDIWTKDENPTIHGQVSDELAGLKDRYVTYTIDGKELQVINPDEEGNFIIEHLPDGNYDLKIEARDNAGNDADAITFRVKKDTVTPQLELQADTVTIRPEQTITFVPKTGCSGAAKIEILRKNQDGNETWVSLDKGLAEGYKATENNVAYTFRVHDVAGGISEPVNITFNNIDSVKPEVKAWAYNNDNDETPYTEADWTNQSVSVKFRNTQNNMGTSIYEWKLDDGAYQNIQPVDNVCHIPALTLEGAHTITMRIRSEGGLLSEEVHMLINLDKTSPKASVQVRDSIFDTILNNITFDTMFKETVKVDIDGEDIERNGVSSGIASIQYFVLESEENEKLALYPTTAEELERAAKGKWHDGTQVSVDPDKTYIVFAKVIDESGNIGYAGSNGLLLDGSGPSINIDYPYHGVWTHDAVIKGQLQDNLAGINSIRYQMDDGKWTPLALTNGQFVLGNLPASKHVIRFEADDAAGNIRWSNDIDVWQDEKSPKISVTGDDATRPYNMVTVTASHDGESALGKVEVKLDDGEYEDITETWKDGYKATQNGTYTFRAVSNAGVSTETTISFHHIYVDELKPVITAKDSEGKELGYDGWSSNDVTIQLQNDPANVDGLKYYYRTDKGSTWQEATTLDKGVVTLHETAPGDHMVEFKVALSDESEESNPIMLQYHIDKTAPEGKITIDDHTSSWDDFLNTITFDMFYQDDQRFTIHGMDDESGVENDHIYYFLQESRDNESMQEVPVLASEIEGYVNGRWVQNETGTLPKGHAYVIYAKIIDTAGNVRYISSDGIVIDDIVPQITSDYDPDSWIIDDAQDIIISIKDTLSGFDLDNGKVGMQINDAPLQNISNLQDDTIVVHAADLNEGVNIIRIHAEDRAGNSVPDFELVVKKDTADPAVDVIPETIDGFASENVLTILPDAGASGIEKIEILYPGDDVWRDITSENRPVQKMRSSRSTETIEHTVRANGTYLVRITNGANQVAYKEVAVSQLDSLQPVVSVTAVDEDNRPYLSDTWTTKNVKISFSNKANNEGVSTYAYKLGADGSYQDITPDSSGVCSFSLQQEGITNVYFRITSRTGVSNDETIFTVKKDTTAPDIDVSMLDGWTNHQSVTLHATDTGSGVADYHAYSFDNGNSWTNENTREYTNGSTIQVMVRDALGNTAEKPVKVALDDLEPRIENAKQNTDEWAEHKLVTAHVEDPVSDEDTSLTSDIQTVFLTAKNPYRNGVDTKKSPSLSDYSMQKVKEGTWKTTNAITDVIGITSDENYWIVAKDNAGNISASSLVVNKILAPDDDKEQPGDQGGSNQKPGGNDGSDKPDDDKGDALQPNDSDKGDNNKPGSDGNTAGKEDNGVSNGDSNKKPDDQIGTVDPDANVPDIKDLENSLKDRDVNEKKEIYIKYLEDYLKNKKLSASERKIILDTLDQLRSSKDSNHQALLEALDGNNDLSDADALHMIDTLLTDNSKETESQDDISENFGLIITGIVLLLIASGAVIIALRMRRNYKKEMKKERDE